MQKYDRIEQILLLLIMVVEIVILFKAMSIDFMLGIGAWLIFHGMDGLVLMVHKKYFRDGK